MTAVANSGTVYNLSLLNKVTDKDGNVLETFGSSVKNQIDVLDASEWSAIHSGMRMVVENSSAFRNFSVNVAGKDRYCRDRRSSEPRVVCGVRSL